MMAENFWFKFYFKDWADDVKPLSLTARGLLIELIIEMRKTNGEMPNDIRHIIRLTGGLTDEITGCLTEFRKFGIFDFVKNGAEEILVSRKIKKEIAISLINKENGKKGGNPSLKRSVNRRVNRTPNSNSNSISESKNKFKSPSCAEVEIFFSENGYKPEAGKKAWHYYQDAEWRDSSGKPVLNWKQKMRGVWFKPENKSNKQTVAPDPNEKF